MNGVQTRFKCKLDVKRCKRFVFPPSSLLPRSNALKTKAIRYFQTDRTLTRIVSPPLNAESFDRDMPIRFLPIKFDKLRMKLEAAKRAGYDKAITFEFSHFMSPQSAYLQAGHLYDRYKEYFDIK